MATSSRAAYQVHPIDVPPSPSHNEPPTPIAIADFVSDGTGAPASAPVARVATSIAFDGHDGHRDKLTATPGCCRWYGIWLVIAGGFAAALVFAPKGLGVVGTLSLLLVCTIFTSMFIGRCSLWLAPGRFPKSFTLDPERGLLVRENWTDANCGGDWCVCCCCPGLRVARRWALDDVVSINVYLQQVHYTLEEVGGGASQNGGPTVLARDGKRKKISRLSEVKQLPSVAQALFDPLSTLCSMCTFYCSNARTHTDVSCVVIAAKLKKRRRSKKKRRTCCQSFWCKEEDMSAGDRYGAAGQYVELTRRMWDGAEAKEAFAIHEKVVAWLAKWRPEIATAVDDDEEEGGIQDAVPVPPAAI